MTSDISVAAMAANATPSANVAPSGDVAPEQQIGQVIGNAKETARESFERLMNGDMSVIFDLAQDYVVPGAIALGVLFVGYLFAKYVSRIASRPICHRVDETLGKFIDRIIFYVIMGAVTALVMNQIGVNVSGAAAIVAAMGFAIGLAFQGTLSNFAAGILLMVFRPFKVGDVVNAAGVIGRVDEIDLFTTILDTPDNRRIIVPNSAISGGTIENVSYHVHRRVEVVVGVDYSADLRTTRAALEAAVNQFESQIISGDGRGASVILSNLGDSAVEWKIRMWVASGDYWTLHEALIGEVKDHLDASGISIPFPQLDVHLTSTENTEGKDRVRPRVRATDLRGSDSRPSELRSGMRPNVASRDERSDGPDTIPFAA